MTNINSTCGKEGFLSQMQVHQRWPRKLTILCFVVMLILLTMTWGQYRAVGDLYVALAAGRDIVNTNFACLTQPDTWSFTTTDRIWLNQNWGSHLIYYLAHSGSGEFGLLALKALLLVIMAAAIVMVCRLRGVNWPVAMLTAGAAIAGVRNLALPHF